MGDREKLTSITLTLQKLIECAVCFEPLKTPFKQCAIGHVACVPCLKTLQNCPTCQAAFTTVNAVFVKNLLEALPKFCCYMEDGCKEVLEQGSDHEVWCGFRLMVCKEYNCDEYVPVNKLLDHYEIQHPERDIFRDDDSDAEWGDLLGPKFLALVDGFNSKLVCIKKSLPVYVFGQMFFLTFDSKDGQLHVTFEVIPIEKIEGDVYARVIFENGKMLYTYCLKAYSSNGNVANENEFCMKIPQSVLHYFTDKMVLRFEVRIFKQN